MQQGRMQPVHEAAQAQPEGSVCGLIGMVSAKMYLAVSSEGSTCCSWALAMILSSMSAGQQQFDIKLACLLSNQRKEAFSVRSLLLAVL